MDTPKNIFNRLFPPSPQSVEEENAIALFNAIENNRVDDVRRILELHPECLHAHKVGCPPMVWAASYMRPEIMKELHRQGAHLEDRDAQGATPFMTVIAGWIQGHAMLSHNPGQPTPQNCDPMDIADWLLSQGALVDARDIAGSTPLSKTVYGFDVIAEYLLKNGAKTETRYTDKEVTLLMIGARSKSYKIVDLLLKHGAQVAATDADGNSALDYLHENRIIGSDQAQEQTAFLLENAMEKHLIAKEEAERIAREEDLRKKTDIARNGTTEKTALLKKIVISKKTSPK